MTEVYNFEILFNFQLSIPTYVPKRGWACDLWRSAMRMSTLSVQRELPQKVKCSSLAR